MKLPTPSPAVWILLAGITAALHVGKLPTALPVLQESMSISLLMSGFLVSLVQLAGVTLGLPVGLSADRLGLRRSIAIGLALLALASLLGGTARTPFALLLCRALEGLGFLLTVVPVPGLLRQLVPAKRLNRSLGLWSCYMGIGIALAMLTGPVLIERFGWSGWWWGLAGWTALVLAGVLRWVPSERQRQGGIATGRGTSWQKRLHQTLSVPGPWLIAFCFGLYSSQWLSVIGFLPSIYHQAGLSAGLVGTLTALVAVINVVGNLGAGQLMHRGVAAERLLLLGFLATALCTFFAFSTLTENLPLLRFAAVLLFSALGGLIPGALFALAVQLAPSENTVSTTVGWMQQWSALGQFVGPPLVALLASLAGGWQWTWWLTGVASLLGILLAVRIARLPPQAQASTMHSVALSSDRSA